MFSPYFTLSTTHSVIELASGQGIHSSAFSRAFPHLHFQPTECDEYGIEQVNQTCKADGCGGNIERCKRLDVLEEGDWKALEVEGSKFDVVIGSNFLHMVPW